MIKAPFIALVSLSSHLVRSLVRDPRGADLEKKWSLGPGRDLNFVGVSRGGSIISCEYILVGVISCTHFKMSLSKF